MIDMQNFKIKNGIIYDIKKHLTGNVVLPDGIIGIDCECMPYRPNYSDEAKRWEGNQYNKSLQSIVLPEGLTYIGKKVFLGNTNLEQITFPSTMRLIEEYAFFGCTSLKEVIFPASLTNIENYAFADCTNLEKVVFQGADTAFTASTFNNCENIKEIIIPENFLATQTRRTAMIIPFIRALSGKEIAYIWFFQDDKWLASIQQKRNNINEVARHLQEIISDVEKLTPKLQRRLVEFLEWAYPEITVENVQTICDNVTEKDAKFAKKFLLEEAVVRGLSSERVVEEPEPIEAFAEALLEKMPMHEDAVIFTKGIPYTGKDKLCPPRLLNILVSEYLYLFDKYQKACYSQLNAPFISLYVPEDAVITTEADCIADTLDKNALSDALENLVYSCGKSYRMWMYAYARFATEDSVKKLTRHAPNGTPAKVRYWRENLEEALLFSNTNAAVNYIEKKEKIERYTKLRGMSVQEFRDKHTIPQWEIDENGVIKSTFGKFAYRLTEDFSIRPFELETGKELRSISSKTYPDAAQEYKNLKKQVTEFYKKRAEYIRKIYITGEQITASFWLETYYGNPVLQAVSEKVIWSDANGVTFMVYNNSIYTADGTTYEPKDNIRIAHVLDMSEDSIVAWQNYLKQTGKKLLIEQVWEPIAAIPDADIYKNIKLSKEERQEFKRVLERKAITVKSEYDYSEFDYGQYRYVFSDTGTMYIGNTIEIRFSFDEDTEETTFLELRLLDQSMSRKINSILFEVARAYIKSAIRNNDTANLSEISATKFTVAQITEFIRIAQSLQKTETIAILLEYKQKHFPDVDPLTEFTLD